MSSYEGKNLYTTHPDRKLHLEQLVHWNDLAAVRPIDKETYLSFAETAGEVLGNEVATRARENNRSTYTVEDGDLVWPHGITESYEALKDTGLLCLSTGESFGGLGLPNVFTMMFSEMLFQADAGFGTIPLLQEGAASLIEEFGSSDLKSKYLPRMVSGEYTGSMDLTEPEAGSDLSGILTRATVADGTLEARVSGTKVFITNGGADVHLVLARDSDTYDATRGTTRGISLYLVPRTRDGRSNGVRVARVEEKIGIHSSPTCAVDFQDAIGYRIGEKGKGLVHMFALMNHARLGVAAQALGIIESVSADARAYAVAREQFGKPIAKHSAVKQMLANMQVTSELVRGVIYKTAFAVDMERALREKLSGDVGASERFMLERDLKSYANQAALLTPLIKFYAAEKAVEIARDGVQVHGGNGYTTEYDTERYLRDAVITTIYEGTSEIQASSFLKDTLKGKRDPAHARADLGELLFDVDERLRQAPKPLWSVAQRIARANADVRAAVDHLAGYGRSNVKDAMFDAIAEEDDAPLWKVAVSALRNPSRAAAIKRETLKNQRRHIDEDGIALQAKRLTTMVVETYGASLLLEQAYRIRRKECVARVFAQEMGSNVRAMRDSILQLDRTTIPDLDAALTTGQ